MISRPRSLRVHRNPIGVLIVLAAFAVAAGCSTANTTGDGVAVNHVDASGNSVSGWVTPTGGAHANSATRNYIANGGKSSCTECHGSDLTGGISRVSCFANAAGCHHGPIAGWVAVSPAAQNHGVSAKKAPGSSGFASCRICHGSGFSGGGADVSCFTCHGVSAPHAPKPWRASAGSTYTHTNTDPANAPVCALCHFPGSPNNPADHPDIPAAAGTPPGCFNSTLCHGTAGAPHPVGNPAWVTTPPAAQPHGDAAKTTPGSTAGFAYCQVCHGTGTTSPANFGGGSSAVSCYTCHGVSAPHAPAPWRASAGSAYDHTGTDTANAPVCYQCHAYTGAPNPNNPHVPPTPASAGTAPGCFNGTMCHNEAGHAVPFNSTTHYSVTDTTFAADCGTCHAVTGTSPISGAPLCTTCHIGGSPLAALNCTSCHATPPDGGAPAGAAYPNVAGAHAKHIALNSAGTAIACDTCHNGLGTGTLNHYIRANARTGANVLRVPPGDAAFLATYDAKTGASSFDNSAALSCSNVSCHGGQATPNWQTGTINVATQCTICHALGTAQYNSYNSGEHQLHVVEEGIACTFCHNITTLSVNHFTTLADNSISPAVASATIGGTVTLINTWTAGSGSSGTCNASCHPGPRSW